VDVQEVKAGNPFAPQEKLGREVIRVSVGDEDVRHCGKPDAGTGRGIRCSGAGVNEDDSVDERGARCS
jgi:hypothetical protein